MILTTRKRALILGAKGFVGSALARSLESNFDVIRHDRTILDVNHTEDLIAYLELEKPDFVINATGQVAGIQGNLQNPATLLINNANAAVSVMTACHILKIPNLIQFASACVYPIGREHPSKVDDLLTGQIEPTSAGYAAAKLLAIEATRFFNLEFGYQWTTFIPSNLYGVGEKEVGENGHVINMLASKILLAHAKNEPFVEIWGDGESKRNFLHVDDLANAVRFRLNNSNKYQSIINVCGEQEISINELANLLVSKSGYIGSLKFDLSKPNGARRKILDDSYFRSLGWSPLINLEDGISNYLAYLREKL